MAYSATLEECMSPLNPVFFVESLETRVKLFYGAPRPETLVARPEARIIVVPRDSIEVLEAIRRIGLEVEPSRYQIYTSYQSRARPLASIYSFRLKEVYSEERIGNIAITPAECGLTLRLENNTKLVLLPPCDPPVAYRLAVSSLEDPENTIIVVSPLGVFDYFAKRLLLLGARKIVIPYCSARGSKISLELAGVEILGEKERIIVV